MNVGFIGLGRLGTQMVDRLIEAGLGPLTLFDVDRNTMEKYSAYPNVSLVPTVVDVALSEPDIVGVCVQNDSQLRDVVAGPEGLFAAPMAPGTVIVVHSTVHPATCRELDKEAEARGIKLIDAAISNGNQSFDPTTFRTTRLVVVGADVATFGRCLPYFRGLGDVVEHAGPVGSGEVVKLLNNLLMSANMGLAAEAIRCGEELGVNRDVLTRALSSGSGSSQGIRLLQPTDRATWREPLLSKDVHLAVDVLNHHGCDAAAIRLGSELGMAALAAHVAGDSS